MKLLQRESLGELVSKKASRGTSSESDIEYSHIYYLHFAMLLLYYSISTTA